MNHVSVSSLWGAATPRWAVPLTIGAIGVSYQVTIGAGFGVLGSGHLEHAVDLLLFGVINPALAFWGWRIVARARRAQQLLDAIDVASADAIVGVDPEDRITHWSRRAEAVLGHSASQARGRALGELLGLRGDPAWLRLREMVRSSGLVRGREATCRNANGEAIPVELSASPVLDDTGRPQGMVVILRDIRRRNERTELIARLDGRLREKVAQLARANANLENANRNRTDLLSLALHEVRAPLAGILGAAERIESSCGRPTAECARMLGLVRGQVNRLGGFAAQVLKAAQIESGTLVPEREPTTVTAIVDLVAKQFCAGNSARQLRIALQPDLPAVYADRDCMAQVLSNLVCNAEKYSPPGKEIEIEARTQERWVRVSVRDHGPGLSAEALERAFDKFYRAHAPETRTACGHGLGLYISRELVLGHGGEIQADNHPMGGAVFSFTIPVLH